MQVWFSLYLLSLPVGLVILSKIVSKSIKLINLLNNSYNYLIINELWKI